MAELDDDGYLWTGEGPMDEEDEEVATLEGELRELRWRPRPLAQTSDSPDVVAAPATVEAIEPSRRGRGWGWVPALGGALLAASAVLAWRLAVRSTEPAQVPEAVSPAGGPDSPDSPDLKDPFARDGGERGFTAPIRERRQGEVSPDLKDPFASEGDGGEAEGFEAPPVSPDSNDPFADPKGSGSDDPRVSPDLKDPFSGSSEAKAKAKPAPELVDPFTGESREVDPRSPDLKDPFASDGG